MATLLPIPPVFPLLVGYGFVVASVVMTGVVDGREGVRALLRQFLIWRVGLLWYGAVLLAPAVIDLAAIAINVLLGGAPPDFQRAVRSSGRRAVGLLVGAAAAVLPDGGVHERRGNRLAGLCTAAVAGQARRVGCQRRDRVGGCAVARAEVPDRR